jgi:hypothetical protein
MRPTGCHMCPGVLTTTVQLQTEEHHADDGQQLKVSLSSSDLLLPRVPGEGGIEVFVSIVVFSSVFGISITVSQGTLDSILLLAG